MDNILEDSSCLISFDVIQKEYLTNFDLINKMDIEGINYENHKPTMINRILLKSLQEDKQLKNNSWDPYLEFLDFKNKLEIWKRF